MLPVSLDCPLLFAPSVFSNVYLLAFLLFILIREPYHTSTITCLMESFRGYQQHYKQFCLVNKSGTVLNISVMPVFDQPGIGSRHYVLECLQ
jgi:hypothetical protein